MYNEGILQYMDYFSSDEEEIKASEFMRNLDNRSRIRFMEVFEDHTKEKGDKKGFATIPKREFNPEISAFSNLVLDFVDFKDRVRPLANDLALMDIASVHQPQSAK